MFDRMIQRPDREARRRSAASLALTSALCAAAFGGFLAGGALFRLAGPEPALVATGAMVMVEPDGGGEDTPLPALPQRPPPRASEPAEVDPDAAPSPAPAPAPAETASAPAGGGGGGTADAEGPGDGGGPPGDGASPRGTGDGELRILDQPKLTVRRRIDPGYPEAARALGLGEQRCLAAILIDEEGAPYEVRVEGCPEAFHADTRKALLQWRWYPPKVDRLRTRARTSVGITYRLDR